MKGETLGGTIEFREAIVTGNLLSIQAKVRIGWDNQKGISVYVTMQGDYVLLYVPKGNLMSGEHKKIY